MRAVIDFAYVPANQTEIHERLENWARWQRGGSPGNVHPMFRQYKAYMMKYREQEAPRTEVDQLDAVAVQKVMAHLPQSHRLAVQWCYVQRSNPLRVCQALGVSKQGLLDLITAGRTMVNNRLTRVETCA